eukprot:11314998-Alexandrium_andersonii.AAC.1
MCIRDRGIGVPRHSEHAALTLAAPWLLAVRVRCRRYCRCRLSQTVAGRRQGAVRFLRVPPSLTP